MRFNLWPLDHPECNEFQNGFVPELTWYQASDRPSGAVIVIPGGGYTMRAPHEGEPIARWLNSLGIHAFVLDYRVSPHRHPGPLRDGQRAVQTVRSRAAEFLVHPDHIAVLGFSAGGHLAGTVGTITAEPNPSSPDPILHVSSRPDALVLCYGVLNLTRYPHQGSLLHLLGENSSMEDRIALSPDLQVDADTPATFLWHTADDDVVSVQCSLGFAEACARHDIPFALHVYPHGRHGLGLATDEAPDVATWSSHAADFLLSLGYASA